MIQANKAHRNLHTQNVVHKKRWNHALAHLKIVVMMKIHLKGNLAKKIKIESESIWQINNKT